MAAREVAEAAQPQRVADDGDRAGGHRDGGKHRRQDAGGGQSRGIVDAVADHRHRAVLTA
jgi:hypothetical protein